MTQQQQQQNPVANRLSARRWLAGVGPWLLAFSALTGLALGACKDDDGDGDESDASLRVKNSCDDYCRQANDCKDEIDEEKCQTDCVDAMTDCQVDEQKEALDKLDACGKESCDDVVACTIDAGAQCAFGL